MPGSIHHGGRTVSWGGPATPAGHPASSRPFPSPAPPPGHFGLALQAPRSVLPSPTVRPMLVPRFHALPPRDCARSGDLDRPHARPAGAAPPLSYADAARALRDEHRMKAADALVRQREARASLDPRPALAQRDVRGDGGADEPRGRAVGVAGAPRRHPATAADGPLARTRPRAASIALRPRERQRTIPALHGRQGKSSGARGRCPPRRRQGCARSRGGCAAHQSRTPVPRRAAAPAGATREARGRSHPQSSQARRAATQGPA